MAESRGGALLNAAFCAALFVGIGAIAGCGGAQRSPQEALIVNVAVTFDGEIEKLPFDPRGERLTAAMTRLAELAGHRVEFRFDVALLPEYRASFEEALIAAAENAARDLRHLSEREPTAYARARELLERVECRYDAAASESSAVFEAPSRRLLVKLHPRAHGLLPEGLLARAVLEESDESVSRRFLQMTPQTVPQAERAAYFQFLTGHRSLGRPADLGKAEGYLEDPAAVQILRVIELYRLSGDPRLRAEIRTWLVSRESYFTSAYVHHPGLVKAAPALSAFHRAEGAWVSWMLESLGSMTDAERLRVTKGVFSRQFNDNVATHGRYPDFVFPGVDKHRFGLDIVDEWRKAGAPVQTPDNPERGLLFEFVVCPHPRDERGHRSRAPNCNYDWYEQALPSPAGRTLLANAVLLRKDRALTDAVFVNAGRKGGIEAVIDLWRAVDRDESTWRVATTVIAEEFAETSGDALMDETRRVYRLFPGRRGALAYVLSQVDRYDNGKVPWTKFAAVFGAPLSVADYGAFLDMGPRAMAASAMVWPAVGPGASRARLIVERLDRYLDDPVVERQDPQAPWSMMRGIVSRVCAEKRADELAVLHSAFQARAARKPSELRPFSNLIEDTRPGACR